jgi:CBS domain-containing protein
MQDVVRLMSDGKLHRSVISAHIHSVFYAHPVRRVFVLEEDTNRPVSVVSQSDILK